MRLSKDKVTLAMANQCINITRLAEESKISRQTLSVVMNGRNIRPEMLGKLAAALKVRPEEIIE